MDEEPSTSRGIKHSIPQELQDEVDLIASKRPRVTATPADLTDNQKRWLVVGICLHSVIAPALRNYIAPILKDLYNELNRYHKIETQIYPTHLQKYPPTNFFLNYEAVNNNKGLYGSQKAKFDYTIKNAVELSKLFQPTHMAQYTGFNETCETSGLLELVINIDKFAPNVRSEAVEVKRHLRNPWAHCDFTKWDAAKYSNAFKLMEKLVLHLSLSLNEEHKIIGKLEQWKMNGEQFLGGTTVGLELVNEIRQQTCVLGEYASKIATGSDCNFTKINNELEKIQILLINRIDQLQKDMDDIDKRVKAQDKIIENQHTQLADFNTNLNKCACHDFHNVDIELWKEQEAMFVETPVVEDISQILESDHSVLIVGEPGIGKSMLMHHIALKLHTTMNYTIIPCSAIQDIKHHYKEGIKQMFVFDDIVGRFTASLSEIEYLQKQKETFNRMLKKGEIKIAATCRLDIYSDEKFHASCTVFTSNIINLSKEYSKENKLKICAKYLTETSIQDLKDKNEVFTPLMCYLYSKNENFNLTDFLHCPYETYQKEWDKLKSVDPYKYCALFLCVLHNGIIKESLFDIYSENISSKNFVLKNIFEICGLNRGTSRCKMETVFDSMIGTYVRKTSNEYRVIHDQMFDFMCGYFGNKDTMVRCILRNACIQVLNERTQLEYINEQSRKFTILITNKYEPEYFMRIQNELQLGNQRKCFYNPQMNHKKYRASFIKVLLTIDDKFLFRKIHPGTFSKYYKNSYFEFLITSCSQGYYDIVQFFVSKDAYLDNCASFDTPLTAACGSGHEKIVQLLIDNGCDVNEVHCLRLTPLTAACWGRNEKVVQLLIDKGCNINQVDGNKQTPLTAACWGRNEKVVQLLIENGCNVNQADRNGRTPLTSALEKGHDTIVQLLIDKGCDVNHVDGKGKTPLIAACELGNEKIVQLLIDNGCNVNHADSIEQSPLIADCEGGNEKAVQLLKDILCNINQVEWMRQKLLEAACKGGNEKIVLLLIAKGCTVNQVDESGQTLLTAACYGGNEKIVQLLIDKGCNVTMGDRFGETSLTTACMLGNEKIVQLLIDNGCNVNQADSFTQTPLTAACECGHEKTVQLLIAKGCNINQVDGKGQTPFIAACNAGNYETEESFIDIIRKENQAASFKQTPLTAAFEGVHEKIMQLLIAVGCDINQVDDMGQTPLVAACNGGYTKIVQLLLDKGCDFHQTDDMRHTPLTAACWSGKEKVVQFLVDKGCDINEADGLGMTPMTAACRRGHNKIIQFLKDKGC